MESVKILRDRRAGLVKNRFLNIFFKAKILIFKRLIQKKIENA